MHVMILGVRTSLPVLHELHHKYHFARKTSDWLCAAPKTHLIESAADLAYFGDAASAWVFKAVHSRFASRTLVQPHRRQLAKIAPTRHGLG